MRIWKRNRLIRQVVLGFAVVALVVPGAAMAGVDEGIGMPNMAPEIAKDQGGVVLADPKYGQTTDVARNVEAGVVLADPKYGLTTDVARHVELRDFPKSLTPAELRTYGDNVSTPQVVVDSKGFDWSDAGIGAGILAGLVLLGGAAYFGTRHLGRPQTA
jgi:hypothetical protein